MPTGRLLAPLLLAGSLILPPAPAPAPAGPSGPGRESWVGWVERHEDHHDYFGSPCPEQPEGYCTANMVLYRIVPAGPEVAAATASREGQRTRLWGTRAPADGPEHEGVLHVERVEPAA